MAEDNPHADKPNFDPFNLDDVLAALKEENEDLLKRRKAIETTADAWDKIAEIKTEAQAEALTMFLRQIGNVIGEKGDASKRQSARKKAYTNVGNGIFTWFKEELIEPLQNRASPLNKKLATYLVAKKAAADAEAARLAAEAQKLAATAKTKDDLAAASSLKQQAAVVAKGAGVKTDFGQGAHALETWTFEVTNLAEVPLAYLTVDSVAVNKMIKGKNGIREIPGLRIFSNATAVTTN